MAFALFALVFLVLAAWMAPLRAAPVSTEDLLADKTPGVTAQAAQFPIGAEVYTRYCAACHETGAGRAPARIILSNMTPEMIHAALTTGAMQAQGGALSEEQKVQVSQHLSGIAMGSRASLPPAAMCTGARARFDINQPPAFAGWGLDHADTHSVTSAQAGINRANVGKLKLKWAFGFPGATRARSQPALGGGAIFVGSHGGMVYALDRETGCVRWQFDATAEVRTGIVLSPWRAGDTGARPLAFFGDWQGNAYAVEAFTGKLVWKVRADQHPAAVITATPVLWQDTLYVAISSLEEAAAATPGYVCCTFRGSMLALDARTGAERWRKWLVDQPVPQAGGKHMGPSGLPVWAGMAVDTARQRLIIGTGGNYSRPTTRLTDSIVALDLATGDVVWDFQLIKDDAWNVDCVTPDPDQCPVDAGPDYNFGTGAALARGKDGRDYVVNSSKAGIAFALDAATGAVKWTERLGRGGMAGGTHFGIATVDGRLIVPISDMPDGTKNPLEPRPGIHALDIVTGTSLWQAPAPQVCEGRPFCLPGYSGAISVTPELLFAGSDDGFLRIYDVATGKVLWETDTMRDFATVNGVAAKGGAMSGGAAPIADHGQLVVSSGYGFVTKMPGNVLLVFEPE
ncbi:PQQ-binding-like beta-propeller repeat protein [Novosphingobium album (ex Liu et al. 2023)]|uniref:PQQ-binding-like beta-propeller repeat protein n=1 Tax=Novosphingobium album (ex Liu et al. 2023) TaxID=3031130 RepID=A0ABT5WMJ9_9SPHN|nr:PQQ-binding-like beta-propeller repeat protein [Novosphingobium album (ex Liu et al. 2023)]MDE8650158.1 PQQ-binding-like beta-propeller repeat protein [Novosphingobium album (ex Liu et al. 2023)]